MHEILRHPSEIRLRLVAASFPELLVEAGRALAELQLPAGAPGRAADGRTIEIIAADRAALLVDWINELVFLAETERWIATELDVERADDHAMRARVRGVRVNQTPTLVKAATLHGVRVEPTREGVEAEVILDV